jgi:diguanylate cyclase (GGDEF)-like protein
LPVTLGLAIVCLPFVVMLAIRVGLVTLIPYVVVAALLVPMGMVLPRRRHPEIWLFGADLVVTGAIAAAVAISGGSNAPGISLIIWPIVAVAGRHTQRALVLHVAITIALLSAACSLAINTSLAYGGLRYAGILTSIAGVTLLVVALTRAERQARAQALVDPLTGVLNRLALGRRMEELAAQAARGDGSLCVIAADIDHFKRINDTFGHDLGDLVLRGVADQLRTNLRAFPLLYRTGGGVRRDPAGDHPLRGGKIGERLRAAVEDARPSGIQVTVSLGIATSSGNDLDPAGVIAAADRCLYRAKREGRNRVVVAHERLAPGDRDGVGATRRLSLAAHADRLLAR